MSSERFFQDLRGVFGPTLKPLSILFTASLNRGTTLQLGEIRPVDQAELQADFPGQVVLITLDVAARANSEAVFLMPTGLAAIWADLMARGEGKAEFAAEQHLDAMSELMSQVGGGLGRSLSTEARADIQIGLRHCQLGTVAEKANVFESYFRLDLFVKSEQMSQALLTLLLSPEAAQDLTKIAGAAKKPGADRPPPAILEEAVETNDRPEVRPARFEDFGSSADRQGAPPQNIDMLMDLELPVIIELGRTSMFIRDILDLGPGSIVELSKLSGEPVDLYVNDKKFALGEVVVIDENFGIRITDLMKVEDRIRSLK